MMPEERQRQRDFILSQQAQADAAERERWHPEV
jgi:hypothetical protein